MCLIIHLLKVIGLKTIVSEKFENYSVSIICVSFSFLKAFLENCLRILQSIETFTKKKKEINFLSLIVIQNELWLLPKMYKTCYSLVIILSANVLCECIILSCQIERGLLSQSQNDSEKNAVFSIWKKVIENLKTINL